nr:response regulator transcription factor [uncultured Treponema sp.]
MQSALKILFVDDHEGIRNGIGQLLQQKDSSFDFVYASSIAQAFEQADKNPDIDVVIVDINLDGENGLSLIHQIRKILSNAKFIVYTMYSDSPHIMQALKSRIDGYITKDAPLDELEKAIVSVTEGNIYYNKRANQIMHLLLDTHPDDLNDKDAHILELVNNYKNLSKKEQEVFKLLAMNKTSREVSEILGKAEKTIINQRSNIYGKLNLHDRFDLIEAAKILGVIA